MNIITRKQLIAKTGLSRDTIRRLENAGKFPRRIQLTERRVGWDDEAVDAWLTGREPVKAA